MFLLILASVLLVIYISVNIIKVILHNYRAHNFFKTKSPQLPVVPNPNIITGNMNEVTWRMRNCRRIDELHNKYGKNFGFYVAAQPWLSSKDIDLIKKIEIDEAYKHLDRQFVGFPVDEFNTSIFQVNGDEWRQVRRAIAPSLTNLKVRSDEVSLDIEQVLDQFIQAIERKLDKAEQATNKRSIILNAHNYTQRITLAVIFSVTYRKENIIDFDAAEDAWTKHFHDNELLILNPFIKLAIVFPFFRPIATWLFQFTPIGQMHLRIVEYIHQSVDLHRAAKERHDKMQRRMSIETGAKERPFSEIKSQPGFKRRLIDGVIDALMEKKITLEQFIGSAHFLLLAGFETTASTSSCLLWQLAQNTDVQSKLRKAIIEEGIDADYVHWCLMEIIRWHPAVPLGVGRVIGEDVTTNDGILIPKGTFLMPSIYSIHHDESIWPEHEKFMPERWRYSSTFHPAAFMGFGLGPRNCLGGKMAIHELKLMMKAILTRYKVEVCEDTVREYKFKSPGLVYTVPDKPILLRFTKL